MRLAMSKDQARRVLRDRTKRSGESRNARAGRCDQADGLNNNVWNGRS
jgi:hypothetical protein